MDRYHYPLRRLHSLLGLVPIGLFVCFHLVTNSSIAWGMLLGTNHHGHAGVEMFQHEVNFIHNLPSLPLIEWGGLFLPILFHGLIGILFALSGKSNVKKYGYAGNWRYTLQRLTGFLGVIFIFMHVTSLRYGWTYGGFMPVFAGDNAASSTAFHFQNGATGLLMTAIYLVCVLSLVFHFANGLWTIAITWGLTLTVEAQRRWGYVCTLIGLGLGAATIAAVIGFSTLDIEKARLVETKMLQGTGHSEVATPDLNTEHDEVLSDHPG